MRRYRIATFLLLILFIFSLLSMEILYYESRNVLGDKGFDKITLELVNYNNKYLPVDLVDTLKNNSDVQSTLSIVPEITNITSQLEESSAYEPKLVYGVKGDITKYYNIEMIQGSFFVNEEKEIDSDVVVLSEELAVKLFGNKKVVNSYVYIYDKKFKVIGVINNSKNKFLKVVEKDNEIAYIPVETMGYDDDVNRINNAVHVELIKNKIGYGDYNSIKDIGINEKEIIMDDFEVIELRMTQRYKMLYFVSGMLSIIFLILILKSLLARLIIRLKQTSKMEYLSGVLKKNYKYILLNVIVLLVIVTLIIYVWRIVVFDFVVITDKKVDSFLSIISVFWESIINFVTPLNQYIISSTTIVLYLEKLSIVFFYLSIFTGIVLLLMINKQVNLLESVEKELKIIGIYGLIGILITVIIYGVLGFSLVLYIFNILKIYFCIFVFAVYKVIKLKK